MDKAYVMIYFSAHWCPPCRYFTPQLAEAFLARKQRCAEIVFVSSDYSAEEFAAYFEEMPWFAVPYSSREKAHELSKRFGVTGIPCLVVLDASGKLVTNNGRAEYEQ